MNATARILKGLLTACLLCIASCKADDLVVYSNDFRGHYPKPGRSFELNQYDLESPVLVWDHSHRRKVTIQRTRGDKYGYEQQKGVIKIEGDRLERARFLSVVGFRSIDASWITEKLVLIRLDIGHIAGVEAIYDVERAKLLYCESVTYLPDMEPRGAPRRTQPFNSDASRAAAAAGR